MYRAEIIRHGPKKDDPSLHLIPGAATLDEKADKMIREYADRVSDGIPGGGDIGIFSTIVKRATQTAGILHDSLMRMALKEVMYATVASPQFDSIGSYANYNGEEVNLGSKAMSAEWKRGKQIEWEEGKYSKGVKKEDLPLLLWCQKGFDNNGYFGLNLPDGDSGISLREIATRVGSYILDRIEEGVSGSSDRFDFLMHSQRGELGVYILDSKIQDRKSGKVNDRVDFVIQHSGDLEPWLFLTLAMREGHDGSREGYMVDMFNYIGGGFKPLQGVTVADEGSGLYLTHPLVGDKVSERIPFGKDILQEQRRWVKEHGIGDKVLEQRLKFA